MRDEVSGKSLSAGASALTRQLAAQKPRILITVIARVWFICIAIDARVLRDSFCARDTCQV